MKRSSSKHALLAHDILSMCMHTAKPSDSNVSCLTVWWAHALWYRFIQWQVMLLVTVVRWWRNGLMENCVFLLFSCYAYALTQNSYFRKVTPLGGILLILGWLSVALM